MRVYTYRIGYSLKPCLYRSLVTITQGLPGQSASSLLIALGQNSVIGIPYKVGSYYLGIGDTYQFQSIAAVAIGGTSLLEGNGNYLGTIAGSFTITILLRILAALNLPFGVQRMAYGLIVLISVIMSVVVTEKNSQYWELGLDVRAMRRGGQL